MNYELMFLKISDRFRAVPTYIYYLNQNSSHIAKQIHSICNGCIFNLRENSQIRSIYFKYE